jgi:VanZ family protein
MPERPASRMAGRLSVPLMNRARFVRDILPVLLWMALIFTLSTHAGSATHTNSFLDTFLARFFPGLLHRMTWPELDAVHYYIRKAAHVTEYAILGALMVRALRRPDVFGGWRLFLAAWIICTFYATTDEFHQSFVPGRTPKVTDVMLDSCGAALGIAVLVFYSRRYWMRRTAAPLPREAV